VESKKVDLIEVERRLVVTEAGKSRRKRERDRNG
jgi:hypothetical protein